MTAAANVAWPRSGASTSRSSAASASPSSGRTARASPPWSGCSRRSCSPTAERPRVFGRDAFRDTKAVRRMVNRVSVEASFFKKMSAIENLSYAARFYGLRPNQTRDKIPEILTRVGFPGDRRDRADGEPLTRDAAEGRARPRAPDRADPAPAGRADDRPRPALEAGGAGVHPPGAGRARRDRPALHPRPGRGRDARRPRRDPRRRQPALPRAGRRAEGALQRGDARGGVLRRERPRLRERGRSRHESDEASRCVTSSSGSAA